MSEIKTIINVLCKQLNLLLDTKLRAEYFRLAKFNKTDENVVSVLWNTLHALLTNDHCSKNIVPNVMNHMKNLNYHNPLFYLIPDDKSKGSRELLLAIGFVLSKRLTELVQNEIRNTPFHPDYNFLHHEDSENEIYHITIPKLSNKNDRENFICWLKGRNEQIRNMCDEYEIQNEKILKKFQNSNGSVYSLNKLIAMNNPKYCQEYLEKSQRILEILDLYQLWKKKEHTFWKWMASVLVERGKDLL